MEIREITREIKNMVEKINKEAEEEAEVEVEENKMIVIVMLNL